MDESEFAHLPPFQEQEAETEKVGTKRVLRSSRISSGEEVKQNRTMEESKPEPSNLSRYIIVKLFSLVTKLLVFSVITIFLQHE